MSVFVIRKKQNGGRERKREREKKNKKVDKSKYEYNIEDLFMHLSQKTFIYIGLLM